MSSISLSKATALLVIDVQEGFRERLGQCSAPESFSNIAQLISMFRLASLPVVHVHHHSTDPASSFHPNNNPDPMPEAAVIPGEKVFIKHVSSGFIGTGLEDYLRKENIKKLVVIGLSTMHCVSTTVRMAENLGWEVYLPRDATATFGRDPAPGAPPGVGRFDARTVHEVVLAELHDEFATVVTTEQVIQATRALQLLI